MADELMVITLIRDPMAPAAPTRLLPASAGTSPESPRYQPLAEHAGVPTSLTFSTQPAAGNRCRLEQK
jgi:hypothetical protein